MPEPTKRLEPKISTLKRLFALGGNECAMPDCTEPVYDVRSNTLLGKVAHIAAAEEGGTRFDKSMSNEDRRAAGNLMVVCGRCHDIIDNPANAARYTVEVLREYKRRHEARMEERRTETRKAPARSEVEAQTIIAAVRQGTDTMDSGLQAVLAEMRSLKRELSVSSVPPDRGASEDVADKILDDEIDGYRDLIQEGQLKTARDLLERRLARLPAGIKPRHLFRLNANIGVCQIRAGDDVAGAERILFAVEHAPEDLRAISNKAFALMILERYREAADVAISAFAAGHVDVSLAVRLVQSASKLPEIEDPLTLAPEQLRSHADVRAAYVEFLRLRSGGTAWWEEAWAERALHPGHERIAHLAAEADLEMVTQDPSFLARGFLDNEQRAVVSSAAAVLRTSWEEFKGVEDSLRPENEADCCNLATALTLLGDIAGAVAVVHEGLQRAPESVPILLRAGVIGVEFGRHDLAERAVAQLPPGPEAALIRFRHFANKGRWKEVAAFTDEDLASLPESEQPMIRAAVSLARLKVSGSEPTQDELKAVLASASDPRSRIVCTDFFRMFGQDRLAEEAFKAAVASVDDQASHACRHMVAFQAGRYKDWGSIVRLLDGFVPTQEANREMHLLATAFANSFPISRRAVEFFETLRPEIAELPQFAGLGGLLHYNRHDLENAEIWLRRARRADPTDLTTLLALIGTHRRRSNLRAANKEVQDCDPSSMVGSPLERMQLAFEMLEAKKPHAAAQFAYETVRGHPNDPEVGPLYFSLLLDKRMKRAIPATETVGEGTWVQIENQENEKRSFLVERGRDEPAAGILTPDHPLSRGAWGLAVGETFDIARPVGAPVTWTVREVVHKYVFALRDVAENHEHRFPDAQGFHRMTVKEGDVSVVFDQVRARAKASRAIADLYLKEGFPLALAADVAKGDPISFATYVRSQDGRIKTCLGDKAERDGALEMIRAHGRNGAVLDLYTAWVCAALDLFGPLEAVLGPLTVPRPVVDQLLIMIHAEERSLGERSMSIGYVDGALVRYEVTREDILARQNALETARTRIERACLVQPVAAPDRLSEEAKEFINAFGHDLLDAAFVASENQGLLLSEDLAYRDIVRATCGVEGVWLQAVLLEAVGADKMSPEDYAKALIGLSQLKHGFLTLSAGQLFEIAAQDDDAFTNLDTVTKNLGGENADPVSHAGIVAQFLTATWAAPGVWHRKARVTSVVLQNLLRPTVFRHPCSLLALVMMQVEDVDGLRGYIEAWALVRGHRWGGVVRFATKWQGLMAKPDEGDAPLAANDALPAKDPQADRVAPTSG